MWFLCMECEEVKNEYWYWCPECCGKYLDLGEPAKHAPELLPDVSGV